MILLIIFFFFFKKSAFTASTKVCGWNQFDAVAEILTAFKRSLCDDYSFDA